MALNIIDLIKGQLGPAVVSQAAAQFGESESGISKAISGLLPAVVGGLANHADNSSILDAITGAHSSGLLGNLLGGSENHSGISAVLSALFGDKLAGLVNAISTFSGVNNSTSNSLLNMVTGAALGSVGKYATENNMGASGISSLLKDQKGIVSALLPAGLSLASLGLGGSHSTPEPENVRVTTVNEPKIDVSRGGETHVTKTPASSDGGSIWKWLLPLVLLVLAAWFLWKQCNKPADSTTTTTDSTAVVQETTMIDDSTMTDTSKELTDIDLNGKALKGYANGLEASMINFLKSDGYKNAASDEALKDTWYSFDNVNFKMGSSTELLPESRGQIENLAEILKAYPDAKIKIGGYTDKVGDAAVNKELSQKRADFIKSELGTLGVGNQVIGAEGYGSEFATVPAEASDAERAVDRKMTVRFAK